MLACYGTEKSESARRGLVSSSSRSGGSRKGWVRCPLPFRVIIFSYACRTHQVLEVLPLREGERLLAQVLPHDVQVQELLPRKVQPPELHAASWWWSGGVRFHLMYTPQDDDASPCALFFPVYPSRTRQPCPAFAACSPPHAPVGDAPLGDDHVEELVAVQLRVALELHHVLQHLLAELLHGRGPVRRDHHIEGACACGGRGRGSSRRRHIYKLNTYCRAYRSIARTSAVPSSILLGPRRPTAAGRPAPPPLDGRKACETQASRAAARSTSRVEICRDDIIAACLLVYDGGGK